MAAKTKQKIDPNQELIGQGLANILGAMSNAYPVSGSFSRSAVNLQSGAVTGLSSLFTSATVALVLLFFTPLLYHLPQAVLAAVIMMAVIGLINAAGFIHAWKAKKYDGIISIVSFLMTLAFAPHLDKGIMIGVGLSLAVFLYKSMRPTVTSLSRFEDESMQNSVLPRSPRGGGMPVHRHDPLRGAAVLRQRQLPRGPDHRQDGKQEGPQAHRHCRQRHE